VAITDDVTLGKTAHPYDRFVGERLEDKYRDHLAQHLELVEPGLTLVDSPEFYLRNSEGASGFVDLLARDQYGVVVAIELKRSDAAARQAMHELFKYVGLLARTHGLGKHQVRCILLSTTWHELLTPFSELVDSSPFDVVGLKLHIGENGLPSHVERVAALPPAPGVSACPRHLALLYQDETSRGLDVPRVHQSLKRIGVEDYILLLEDHDGSDATVMFPFSIYVILAEFSAPLRASIQQGDWFDGEPHEPFGHELAALSQLMETTTQISVENASPDKFKVSHPTWPISKIERSGVYKSSALWDQDTLTAVAGAQGERYTTEFTVQVTPRNSYAWNRAIENIDYCLTGADGWRKTIPALMRDLAQKDQELAVSIRVFSPCDMTWALAGLGAGQAGFVPTANLDFVFSDGTHQQYAGIVLWDGKTSPTDPEAVFAAALGGDFDLYIALHWAHEQWLYETQLAQRHGLSYSLLDITLPSAGTMTLIQEEGGKLLRKPVSANHIRGHTIVDFAGRNSAYVGRLSDSIRDRFVGSDPFRVSE
jgi:hypothetical protein